MSEKRTEAPGLLDAVGLSQLAEQVYRGLVSWGGGTLAEVAASAGVSQKMARDALSSLEAKGLLTRSATHPSRYSPTPPHSAIELLVRARQEELEQVRVAAKQFDDELRAAGPGLARSEFVEVLAPGDGLISLNVQLFASASKEILGFQKPPINPPDEEFVAFKLGILARGVSIRALYTLDALAGAGNIKFMETVAAAGEQSRITSDFPTQGWVVDREVAFLPLRVDQPGVDHEYLLVHRCALLDNLVALFEALWARAQPFDPGTEIATLNDATLDDMERSVLTPDEKQLLALLAVGFNDESIAKQLGLGARTIERRMRHIMDVLGTQTRFQAAVEATSRGLIGRDHRGEVDGADR